MSRAALRLVLVTELTRWAVLSGSEPEEFSNRAVALAVNRIEKCMIWNEAKAGSLWL